MNDRFPLASETYKENVRAIELGRLRAELRKTSAKFGLKAKENIMANQADRAKRLAIIAAHYAELSFGDYDV